MDSAVTNWLLASLAPQSVPPTTMYGAPLLVTTAPAIPVEVSNPFVALRRGRISEQQDTPIVAGNVADIQRDILRSRIGG